MILIEINMVTWISPYTLIMNYINVIIKGLWIRRPREGTLSMKIWCPPFAHY